MVCDQGFHNGPQRLRHLGDAGRICDGIDQVGAARLNLKEVGDTDAATKLRTEWENRKDIGVKGFTPPDRQSIRREEDCQLAFMTPMPYPEESDRSSGNMSCALNGNTIDDVLRCCAEQGFRGNAQVEPTAVRVQEMQHVDMSEKWQKVRKAASLTIAFLASVGGEREQDLRQILRVIGGDRDLHRDAPRGDLKMPVARVNSWRVSDQINALEPETELADRPSAVARTVRLERTGRLQNAFHIVAKRINLLAAVPPKVERAPVVSDSQGRYPIAGQVEEHHASARWLREPELIRGNVGVFRVLNQLGKNRDLVISVTANLSAPGIYEP